MRLFPLTLMICALTSVCACQEDLGTCDLPRARTVVYDISGYPYYDGQALVHVSCGAGVFCHSVDIRSKDRYGAPVGLDFGVALACTTDDACTVSTNRLRRGQASVFNHRHGIADAVDDGQMPPGGDAERKARPGSLDFKRSTGTALPDIRSEAGHAILRNWLACGAPVVERTTPHPSGATLVGEVVPVGVPRTPPEPKWSSIYERLIAPRCASVCHSSVNPEQRDLSQLDFGDNAASAYRAVVGMPGAGADCKTSDLHRVEPGMPDRSLIIRKLSGTQTCGDPMPQGEPLLPTALVDPIRQWILDGALEN